jgi:RNA polymerase sigma-70 factor (ECF subfamily)
MSTTPLTLLDHLRQPSCSPDHWGRFIELYSPLLFEWSRRNGVPADDAPDLVQTVLVTLIKQLPTFERRPGGSFRGWLFTVMKNCWIDHCRTRARQPAIAIGVDPNSRESPDLIEELSETEYKQYLIRRMLSAIQRDFSERTWKAFWQHVVEEHAAAEVAAKLGTSANAVYLARGRILQRLREELAGFIE